MKPFLDGLASVLAALTTLTICGAPAYFTYLAIQANAAPQWAWASIAALAGVGLLMTFAFLQQSHQRNCTQPKSAALMHLAELNIGQLLAPTDDPRVKEFMDNLDRVNGLDKRMPGFVWMSEGSGEPGTGNTENAIGEDPQLVFNLTVWEDLPSLEAFVYKTIHAKFMDRKAEWFEVLGEQHFVMWWIEEGHLPSREDALARLEDLRENGPSARAFGWDEIRAKSASS